MRSKRLGIKHVNVGIVFVFLTVILAVAYATFYFSLQASKPVYYAFSLVSSDCSNSSASFTLKNMADGPVYVQNVTLTVNGKTVLNPFYPVLVPAYGTLHVTSNYNCEYLAGYNVSIGVQYTLDQHINSTLNNPLASVVNAKISSTV